MAKRKSNRSSDAAKRPAKLLTRIAIVLLIIVIILLVIYLIRPDLFNRAFDQFNDYKPPATGELPEGDVTEITSAELSIHFIAPEVRASGDCTLIKVGETEVWEYKPCVFDSLTADKPMDSAQPFTANYSMVGSERPCTFIRKITA